MNVPNKVRLLISFLFLFVTTSCAKDEEMEKVEAIIPIDEITDETNENTIKCSFEKYMSLQPVGKYSAQGSACYGDYFIQGYNYNGYMTIYDLKNKKCLGSIDVPAPTPTSKTHSNTLNFGSQRYHSDDYFPLLYVSSGYATEDVSHIYVYRLSKETIEGKDEFTLTLVQTISLYGFGTWTEGIIDTDSDKLWIKCKEGSRLKYVCYNLPDVSEGNLDIYSENGLRNFQVEKIPAGSRNQGHLFWNDRILLVSGVPQSGEAIAFISINTQKENIEYIINLADVGLVNLKNPKDGTFEPEGVIVYDGQLMICYRKAIYSFFIHPQHEISNEVKNNIMNMNTYNEIKNKCNLQGIRKTGTYGINVVLSGNKVYKVLSK